MATYYLDASALVKRYLEESGSRWLRELLDQSDRHSFAGTELIAVEVVCALTRAERDHRVSRSRRDKLTNLFLAEVEALLEAVPVSDSILQRANQLALRYPLRAYDAMHLATALTLAERMYGLNLPIPGFVSADANLLTAARAEGLVAENPNDHE